LLPAVRLTRYLRNVILAKANFSFHLLYFPASYLIATRTVAQFLILIAIGLGVCFTAAFLDAKRTVPSLFRLLQFIALVYFVSVLDDGVGFDYSVEQSPEIVGFGLFSIHERLRHIGGSLHVERLTSGGSKITILAPEAGR